MNLLLLTNLYPPQELGGYGRSMADFAWGLMKLGHFVQVLCNDADYLGPSSAGPTGEPVSRTIALKGSFKGGVSIYQNLDQCKKIDDLNIRELERWLSIKDWDGIIVGNIDLIGPEILTTLINTGLPVLHHVGFVAPPFEANHFPSQKNYKLVSASKAVRDALSKNKLPVQSNPVVYPGARVELFNKKNTRNFIPFTPDGTPSRPLKVCFAGLLMGSKGAHTIIEALILLKQQSISIQVNLAGDNFEPGYKEKMQSMLKQAKLESNVCFLGQLGRRELARFFSLHHVCVFPSIYPEAFGIVGAEAMASGLVLISSCVGGSEELIENNISGLKFHPGDAISLATALKRLIHEKGLLGKLALSGKERVNKYFSVMASARKLEEIIQNKS